jgi:hypothetical protein
MLITTDGPLDKRPWMSRLRLALGVSESETRPRDTGGTLASKKRQLSTTDDSEPVSPSLCVDCCCLS